MKNSQLINAFLILLGGGLLIYVIAVKDASPYFKIAGLIIIMFGLYRATNYWVATKDDHKENDQSDQS